MPAPPARSRSARVPCGVSSISTSPVRYWRSSSLFSPTYEAISLRICRFSSSSELPMPGIPQLFETTVRSRTPVRDNASSNTAGMPQIPKPPEATIIESDTADTAASAEGAVLSMCPPSGESGQLLEHPLGLCGGRDAGEQRVTGGDLVVVGPEPLRQKRDRGAVARLDLVVGAQGDHPVPGARRCW